MDDTERLNVLSVMAQFGLTIEDIPGPADEEELEEEMVERLMLTVHVDPEPRVYIGEDLRAIIDNAAVDWPV